MARDSRSGAQRPRVQVVALAFAAVFTLVGILGFIPGITTGYGDMGVAGHHSGAKLFGLFQVSILHNALHLVFGLVGLLLARSLAGARLFLAGGGALYLVLWIYGLAIERESALNFIPVNNADNFLHLGLGFVMLVLGLLLSKRAGTGGRLDTPIDRP